ncbi:MAG: hypothetical protein ACI9Y1_001674 [Lentisphaeria bacterium]|jgi:hypothetical protein
MSTLLATHNTRLVSLVFLAVLSGTPFAMAGVEYGSLSLDAFNDPQLALQSHSQMHSNEGSASNVLLPSIARRAEVEKTKLRTSDADEPAPTLFGNQKPPHSFTENSSWAFSYDNDIFVPTTSDQDYTYGLNPSTSGAHTRYHWASLHKPLLWLDKTLGVAAQFDQRSSQHRIEYGLFCFTPEETGEAAADHDDDDRPYASLIYVSSTLAQHGPAQRASWDSTLTLGVMGLKLVGELQESVHSAIGNKVPQGWDHQVSKGGELTARYAVSRQSLMLKSNMFTANSLKNPWWMEVRSTVQASVGYITEASWSIGARFGKIQTNWLSFNHELTTYGEKSAPTTTIKLY